MSRRCSKAGGGSLACDGGVADVAGYYWRRLNSLSEGGGRDHLFRASGGF